jgi:hypothetical protein
LRRPILSSEVASLDVIANRSISTKNADWRIGNSFEEAKRPL